MIAELGTTKKTVSLWLPVAVFFLGFLFFIFVFIEYQRNTSLVQQNQNLISGLAKIRLTNSVLNRDTTQNWGIIKGQYGWIKQPPRTYWFNDGAQEFPWSRPTSNTKDDTWSNIWTGINSPSKTNHLNTQRLSLLNTITTALESNDERSIEKSFEAYLEHKDAYHLSPQQEIAFSLKLVEIGAQEHWSSELVHAILITGGSSEAPIFRPVVDVLFRHAELFSSDDFDWIINTVKRQLEVFNLPRYFLDDYLLHLDEPRFSLPLGTTIANGDLNIVIEEGWFLRRLPKARISAEPIILSEELQLIQREFIELDVLNIGDTLTLNGFANKIPLNRISIDVNKLQLNRDKRNQMAYLIIKSIMLIAFVSLILLTLRLIGKNQQRRFEYLALKEDFVKLVSHELKTPLAGIRAMAETLRKRVERDLSVQTYPERIVNEADKLWYMVDNILGFNRVQLTDAVIKRSPTKMRSICDSIIDDVGSFSNKPYSVSNTIDESIEMLIDAELFSLVVKNIVVNAGLYNKNEIIEIKLTFDESSSCLLIADNGVGIVDADRDKIFKPFVRLTQSVRQSGTGLGLAMCKRIMQLHNGDLSLGESNSHGSVWRISLAK